MGQAQFLMPKTVLPGVAAVVADSDRSFPRHMHDQFGIGLIARGAQKSLSGRGMVEAGAGHVITVNPGEVHDGIPLGEGGRAWRMLYLDIEIVRDAIADISEKDRGTFEFAYPVDTRPLAKRFNAVFSAVTAKERPGETLDSDETLLMFLADAMETAANPPVVAAPDTIKRAKSSIDDDPARPFRLADLAKEAGMSQFRFLRAFAKATGLTPHSYLLQRRVHLARHALADGTRPAEAAVIAGFVDQSHLNRFFVRQFGVTPAVYRAALS
ncbi:AraC family transcriptional regulator [Agrobacterium tumefaciens]|uniref:Transcriptional regulator, AraC family n=1 Tax=Agrobacterium fabrum (strain C58 / ATCC 33970) TaxID=176299 RepID=A9CJT3_AGRFC|nr:AraC family transcriptional regulator [Agrobacterium fabrum]KEY55265.1 AraC family transcriptional regulator [Agrobacterium tumefaciens]AAK86672.1 transcriptional regulator, AraC family [Agrobacterium fabrum str. C58]KJX89092.1 putative HTH-type transcriptional regulator ybfI [Agrobacterium tumefaciens]MCX2874300.1 AraC family transcriptional regulator [Agrobacterium fabrum]NMV68457.1 AraC family transcriptional regulator [Agrobacterium fabrum]